MKRAFNKAIRSVHVWMGLGIGSIFCIMSLSGSVLVLRPFIEDLLRPVWTPRSTARPSQVLTAASRAIADRWPGSRLASVTFAEQTGKPVEFGVRAIGGDELRVFADARSGELLGTFATPWLDWLTDLHHHALVESIGKKVVGFIGIFLIVSSLTGLWIWFRRWNRWRQLCPQARYTKYDLHRQVGVIGNALLLFVAATGVTMAFPQTLTQLLGGPAREVREQSVRDGEGGHASLEQYVSSAERAVPNGAVRQLKLPRREGDRVTARVWTAGDLRQSGSTRVSIEAGTARVVSLDKPSDWPIAKSIVQAATPLHYAEWGGPALRIAWFCIGLMPPVLFVSGVMMWWTPYAAKRKAARLTRDRDLTRQENLVA